MEELVCMVEVAEVEISYHDALGGMEECDEEE